MPRLAARYAHTNLVARDWRRLARFYEDVFGCRPVPPQRAQSGRWLEEGTGVAGARLEGLHLRLPGHGEKGPTLEIYRYDPVVPAARSTANQPGLRHLAFEVADVETALAAILEAGGSAVGRISGAEVPGVGRLTFVYAADPEGNLLEIQRWILDPSTA